MAPEPHAPSSSSPSSSCTLRVVRPEDTEAVLSAFAANPDMARQGEVETIDQARTYVDWLLGEHRRAVAVTGPDDTMIGLVALSIDEGNKVGWFFYWMHEAARGKGVTARAAATVAHRALSPIEQGGWGLDRLELGHRANNPASGAVARAAGFVHEGTERQKFLIDGERHDVHTYGCLRTDPPPATQHLPWRY